MEFKELARITRSVRRFRQSERIPESSLVEIMESVRLAPCGANLQLLRFTIETSEEGCEALFPALNWAGYLRDWNGPARGQRPSAYIVLHMPLEERRHLPVDAGIAAAYIVLAARERGYGSCMIMSMDPQAVVKASGTPDGYRPFMVIALGVADEEVVLEEAQESIEYYRDAQGRHHVPKRPIRDILTD